MADERTDPHQRYLNVGDPDRVTCSCGGWTGDGSDWDGYMAHRAAVGAPEPRPLSELHGAWKDLPPVWEGLPEIEAAGVRAVEMDVQLNRIGIDDVQDIIAAVRPLIAAEALRWVAAAEARWDGYCCHDHMAEVVRLAADEIESGTEAVPPGDAEAARRARDAEAVRRAILGLDWDAVEPYAPAGDLDVDGVVDAVRRYLTAHAARLVGEATG